MSNAARKEVFPRPAMRELGKDKLLPNPAEGDHQHQVLMASAIVFARYRKLFERLSKV